MCDQYRCRDRDRKVLLYLDAEFHCAQRVPADFEEVDGKTVEDDEAGWNFICGQMIGQVPSKGRNRREATLLGNAERDQRSSAAGAFDINHYSKSNFVVGEQFRFNFRQLHVVAANLDLAVGSTDHLQHVVIAGDAPQVSDPSGPGMCIFCLRFPQTQTVAVEA